MRALIAVALAGLCLAGCDLVQKPAGGDGDKPAETASGGSFSHTQTQDLSGYYLPEGAIGPSGFALTTLFIGQAEEFRDWETGKRSTTFAPVMLEFGDERVLPDSYSISDGRVRMTGTSASHGRVTLDGQLDAGALANARRNLGEGEAPTLTATLNVGGQSYSGVKLSYSVGD